MFARISGSLLLASLSLQEFQLVFHLQFERADEGFFLFDEPLAKVFDHRFDAGAMAHTIPLVFEQREIAFNTRCGQLFRLKVFALSRSPGNPCDELTQDTCIGINGCFVEPGERWVLIACNPLVRARLRERNTV